MTHIIAIAHHAGGVGKTTTTLNLGYALAAVQRTVLLADLDPQADLTQRLGVQAPCRLAEGLLSTHPAPVKAHLLDWPGMALLPSTLEDMAGIELRMAGLQRREDRLRLLLSQYTSGAYALDYILLDCPPAINLLTVNALYAADSVLVPVQAQDKALRQLQPLLNSLMEVQSYRGGHIPALGGLLLTMTDRTRQSQEAERALRDNFGTTVYETTIPRRTAAADDGRYQAPVAAYAPESAVAYAYRDLAQEVMSRAETYTPSRA